MLEDFTSEDLLVDYYEKWIRVYKVGAIREVTLSKYYTTLARLKELIPYLKLKDVNRISYQELINAYAKTHERQTTMDFHHQIKGALLDALDEGLIFKDPTRRVVIKGCTPVREKKIKFLNQFELHKLLQTLELTDEITWDWLILLVAKTGLRFSEALGLTPEDFYFSSQYINVDKTWDYKSGGGFTATKNKSSVRKIPIDWQTVTQFAGLIKDLPVKEPIFTKLSKKIYNSTANDFLTRKCKEAEVPVISIHGLRHTHASLLLFGGVSIMSVAKRLGHASATTTQKVYLHIIRELESADTDLVMRQMSNLN